MRKKILFVGSFKKENSHGHVGGQMFACNSLINSNLSDEIDWVLLDTTAKTNLSRSFITRSYYAVIRMLKGIYFIMTGKVDIVMAFCSGGFSFLEKGMLLKIAKRFGKRTILAPRSGYLIDDIENSPAFRNKAARIFSKVDCIVCQGTFWKEFFAEKFEVAPARMIVIHNWLDNSMYDGKVHSFRPPMKLLFMGWVERNKGIWDLLEAVKILKEENFELNVAGEGKEFDAFKAAVIENELEDKIRLLGWVLGEEKLKLLNHSDVFVLPSYREGLPNSMLEAMSSKCAIIVSNVGAVPDIISNAYNGYLINPGNPRELARKIKIYLDNPSLIRLHSDAALHTVSTTNSIAGAVEKFRSILN